MNKSTILSTGFATMLLAMGFYLWQSSAPAQEKKDGKEDRRGTLTTAGMATSLVKPDSARVFFRVESYAEDIKTARADNAKLVDAVITALRKLQIINLKMKSSDVNVELVTRNRMQEERLPKILGYHVTHSFTVLVENQDAVKLAEDASRVLDAALEHGATGVDQITFFARDLEKARRELLTRAVEEALRNARALAAGANRKINDIATIHGQPEYNLDLNNYQRLQNSFVPTPGASTPLVAGDLVLTCNVNVSCKYDN